MAEFGKLRSEPLTARLSIMAGTGGADLARAVMATWFADRRNHVSASLRIHGGTWLEALPEGLRVDGDLEFYETRTLCELPTGLRVGGHIDLGGSRISELPQDLEVGKDERGDSLWLDRACPLHWQSDEAIRAMVPGVRGNIRHRIH